jgi:catechol 2,3-dioxygenase-like lactoylglutathione lyase family enzyme
MQLHHAVLFVRDSERSVRFYRDGLGLTVLRDLESDNDWPGLLGVESKHLHAVIMGDPDDPDVGQVEVLTFAEPVPDGPPPSAPTIATVMLSFHVHLDTVLPKVLELGATEFGQVTLKNGTRVVTVRDPDGILVEMLDTVRSSGT